MPCYLVVRTELRDQEILMGALKEADRTWVTEAEGTTVRVRGQVTGQEYAVFTRQSNGTYAKSGPMTAQELGRVAQKYAVLRTMKSWATRGYRQVSSQTAADGTVEMVIER